MVESKPRVVAVIPARSGSKRLARKNIRDLHGKPLVAWAIETAQRATRVDQVYVSTESAEIAAIAKQYGAEVLERPEALAGDTVRLQEVARHALTELPEADVLVFVGANAPGLPPETLDAAIDKLVANNRWEVRSVDANGLEHFVFWAMTRQAAFWDGLSVYFAVHEAPVLEIHTAEDLEQAHTQVAVPA